MIRYKYLIIGLVIILSGCKSSFKSYKDGIVSLYDGQAHLMNGTYYVDPFYHSDEYVELQELLDLQNTYKFLEKIEFKFIDDQTLKIIYTNGLSEKTKIIKGKLTKGGFQIDRIFFAMGIPGFLFSYIDKRKMFYLGNDDDLIYQYYYKSSGHFFGRINTTKESKIIKFDRQLPK